MFGLLVQEVPPAAEAPAQAAPAGLDATQVNLASHCFDINSMGIILLQQHLCS